MMFCRHLAIPARRQFQFPFIATRTIVDSFMETDVDQRIRRYQDLSMEEIREIVIQDEIDEAELLADDEEETYPWKVLLGPAARAIWRVSSHETPSDLEKRQEAIFRKTLRTKKQLRRSFEKIIKTHRSLAGRRDRERQIERGVLRMKKGSLQAKHANASDDASSAVFYSSEPTCATLVHRLLPNYGIAKRVLLEAKALVPDFSPKKVIDFGVGVGSSSAAALDVFDGIEWIHGVDPSVSMRECAEAILSDRGPRITTDSTVSHKSGQGTFDMVLFAYTATELPKIPAVLAAAAVLWERLAPNGLFVMIEPGTPDGFSNIRSVRSMLLECCPPNAKRNVEKDEASEVRSPSTNGEVNTAENMEADRHHDDEVYDECHIIAPCTHNGSCPMDRLRRIQPKVEEVEDDSKEDAEKNEEDGEGSAEADFTEEESLPFRPGMTEETEAFQKNYCSFVHTIPGRHNEYKGDKLSYLVAQKRYPDVPAETTDHPFSKLNIADMLAQMYRSSCGVDPSLHEILYYEALEVKEKFLDLSKEQDPYGLSVLVGDENRKAFGRIIRAPVKRQGHVLVDYCAGNDEVGRIVRHSVSKGRSTHVAPGQHSAARKARWGGFWPDTKAKLDPHTDEVNEEPLK